RARGSRGGRRGRWHGGQGRRRRRCARCDRRRHQGRRDSGARRGLGGRPAVVIPATGGRDQEEDEYDDANGAVQGVASRGCPTARTWTTRGSPPPKMRTRPTSTWAVSSTTTVSAV